jgi:hypothetical protein
LLKREFWFRQFFTQISRILFGLLFLIQAIFAQQISADYADFICFAQKGAIPQKAQRRHKMHEGL